MTTSVDARASAPIMLARDPDAYATPQARAMLEQARADGFDVDSMLVADWDAQTTRPAASAD